MHGLRPGDARCVMEDPIERHFARHEVGDLGRARKRRDVDEPRIRADNDLTNADVRQKGAACADKEDVRWSEESDASRCADRSLDETDTDRLESDSIEIRSGCRVATQGRELGLPG